MDQVTYYRERATHFRQLAELAWQQGLETMLRDLAEEYDNRAASMESVAERGKSEHRDSYNGSRRMCEQQKHSTGNSSATS